MLCHVTVHAIFARLARIVVRRPWLVIAGWLVGAGLLIATAPSLTSVTNADQAAFLPETAESAAAAKVAEQTFPDSGGTSAVMVIRRVDGAPLTDADLAVVTSLSTHGGRSTVAPNRAVALVAMAFPGAPESEQVREAVGEVRASTGRALTGTGLTAGMTGEAAIAVDNASAFSRAERTVTVVTLVLIVALLLLIFRSPVAALLPLLTVGIGYLVSGSLIALGGHAFDIQVGRELPTMLTVVLFGIGTDYVLFLLFRYRERLRAGDSPGEAIVTAVERVGAAICSAAFAVIAAFGALVLAVLGFFSTLGPALALGVAVMLLAALTLVPALVAVLGRRVFWPTRPARRTTTRWHAGRLVARWPVAVLVGSVLVLGGLAAGVPRFVADYDPIAALPPGTEAAVAFDDMRRGFPAGALQPTTVYLTGDRPLAPAEIEAYAGRLATVAGVAGANEPRVAAGGGTVAIDLVLRAAPYSAEALDLVGGPLRVEARAAAPAGTHAVVGGPSMAFADVRAATNRDLAVIFPIAGLLFALILAWLLRAALAPVYLVAAVVLNFAATLGATAWVFRDGLAFSLPIILYLFVTAIGTDYNILVTARLREEIQEGRSPREAAALAVARAGPTVGAAAVILAGTFAALLVSGVPFFVEIGFAVTLGILLVAFVVSIMLVPALTALAGRAAWWPGRPRSSGVSARGDGDPPEGSIMAEPAQGRLSAR